MESWVKYVTTAFCPSEIESFIAGIALCALAHRHVNVRAPAAARIVRFTNMLESCPRPKRPNRKQGLRALTSTL
jgi:hypothetical protein